MKKIVIFCIILSLVLMLPSCGKTNIATSYSYEIKTTLDNSPSDGKIPIYTFSRPVFEETSEIAKTINDIYADEEKAYVNEMEESGYFTNDYPDDFYWSEEYPWHYTALSECTYEKDGIISFTLNSEWYMGTVYNSWKKGHTFDFTLNRELKINDVLKGDESQITAFLENEFYKFIKDTEGFEVEDDADKKLIKEQSGLNADFYLADDGVHVFYEPYILPATQNGVDILIAWTNANIKKLH